MPPETMAPASHGRSRGSSGASAPPGRGNEGTCEPPEKRGANASPAIEEPSQNGGIDAA
jgi:hypothetical protein